MLLFAIAVTAEEDSDEEEEEELEEVVIFSAAAAVSLVGSFVVVRTSLAKEGAMVVGDVEEFVVDISQKEPVVVVL